MVIPTQTLGYIDLIEPIATPFLPRCEICYQKAAIFEGKTRQVHAPWAYFCKDCVHGYANSATLVARSIRASQV